MHVRPEEIAAVARLIHHLCGVVLDDSKDYLIDSRLGRLAETLGCANFTEFCQKVQNSPDHVLKQQVVEAITTRETLFFRDHTPFEALQQKILPELIKARSTPPASRSLRIWSAACSTGQEPYSIAMVLCDLLPDRFAWNVSILASDISEGAIKQAMRASYSKHEVERGMPPHLLTKHFRKEGECWHVVDAIHSLVSFEHRNLLEPFDNLGDFDIIFCRNVAIYFDAPTRRDLFRRLAERLSADGILIVGASESLSDLGPEYLPIHCCRSVYYQPKKRPASVPC